VIWVRRARQEHNAFVGLMHAMTEMPADELVAHLTGSVTVNELPSDIGS